MSKTALLKIFLLLFNGFSLCLIFFLYAVRKLMKMPASINKAVNISIAALLIILGAEAFIYVDARYIEPNWIKVEKVPLMNKNFPKGIEKLRIIQLSDLHISKYGIREHMLIAKTNALRADLILITGDFVNKKNDLSAVLSVLSRLHAKKGIYAVLGDIDYYAFGKEGIDTLKAALEKININILNNESVRISLRGNKGLWLIGLGESSPRGMQRILPQAYQRINLSEPKIVLAHSQRVMESGLINTDNADLVLVGDTHGAQMGLAFIRKLSRYASRDKYIAGLFYVNGVPLYVNRGIGTKTKPIRFLCRPEITLITLRRG